MLNLLFIYLSQCIFAKFLMSFLKAQVTFPLNFASIFNAIRHNSSVLFLAQTLYFGQRSPLISNLFKVFKCPSQNLSNSSCQFWNDISLQILHYSSLSWHITPLEILWSYLFYIGQKNSINVPILTLSSALVKIYQILKSVFKPQFRFSSKFAYLFSVMKDNSCVLL